MENELTTRDTPQALTLQGNVQIDQHPGAVYLAGLGVGSRRAMDGALNTMAVMLAGEGATWQVVNWPALRFQHTAALRTALVARYAPATVRRHLSALRGVLKAAWRLEQISTEDYGRAVDLGKVEGTALPAGRMLADTEVAALLDVCRDDPSPAGARDAAMIGLWVVGGPRRAEMVNLDVADYAPETGTVTIRSGKRSKSREVYVDNEARAAMDDWLKVRGAEPGALFVPVHGTGKLRIARMTSQAAYALLERRARKAGIDKVSPHDLRRTAISNLIDASDLSTAQKIAGHEDPKTTSLYDRRDERAKKRAASKMHVAYEGRRQ